MKKSILIVGVGGQGTVLASKLLGLVALKSNLDVKVSEVHGMAQRGGSVVTYVKIAPKVYSPLVDKGEGDIMIAFEELEALRWSPYVKDSGTIIYNNYQITPTTVHFENMKYPENIHEKIVSICEDSHKIDGLTLANEAGNQKTLNTIMMGLLAKKLEIPKEIWLSAIHETVPERFLDVNLKAFDIGYNYTL